jgi:hypothetical protein
MPCKLGDGAAQRPVACGQRGGGSGRHCVHGSGARLPQRTDIRHHMALGRCRRKVHGGLRALGLRCGPGRIRCAAGGLCACACRACSSGRGGHGSGGCCTRRGQRVFHRMAHGLVHLAAVTKAHLDLGGVHVHIHARRVDFYIQRIHRLAVAVQHVFIGAAGRVGHHLVAHIAAVHIRKLLVGPRARGVGYAGAACHPQRPGLVVHRHALRQQLAAQHIGQALVARGGAPLFHQLALVPDRKADLRAGQARGDARPRRNGPARWRRFSGICGARAC